MGWLGRKPIGSKLVSETIMLDQEVVPRVIDVVHDGDLAVVPTDTVYAVVANAFDPDATGKLYRAKQRQRREPLAVIIRTPRQVSGLVSAISEAADRLMASYWPGPLTLVFLATEGLSWQLGETRGTVAMRMPTDELLLDVASEIGPLACTAANRRGDPPPTTCDQARAQLGEEVALYVDGGERTGPWSTVVDVTGEDAVVLREGALPGADIEAVATGAVGWGERPPSGAGGP